MIADMFRHYGFYCSTNGLLITLSKSNNKYGFSKEGKEVIPCKYDYAYNFNEGLAIIRLDGKLGLVNEKGEEFILPKYNNMYNFNNGLAPVLANGKWGFVNDKGEEVIPCIYDTSLGFLFNHNLASVMLNGKYGFIDKTGKEIIPCVYDYTFNFRRGLTKVNFEGKWGLLDIEGKEVAPCIYDSISYHNDKEIGLAILDRKSGFIDIKNKPIQFNKFMNYILNIGSRHDTLHYTRYKDTYIFATGCFIGTLKEFEKAVNDEFYKYKHPKAYDDYMKIIEDLKGKN